MMMIAQHMGELARTAPSPVRSRYMLALERAQDCDLRNMLCYCDKARCDKRAFYLCCETLARQGSMLVEARDEKTFAPLRLRIVNGARVRDAMRMFFDDAKTQYNVQKRFVDLQWMLLVSYDPSALKCRLLANDTPGVTSNRKLYSVPSLGSLVLVSEIGMLLSGSVMVWVKDMPNRGTPIAPVTDNDPERLVSQRHLHSLMSRMEAFWTKKLRTSREVSESGLYAMEQYFNETLETLTEKKVIEWPADSKDSFKILDAAAWRKATKIFCGHRMRDAMIAWVRLLGWVSTENTVPPPGRSTNHVSCLTFRRLSAAEQRDLKLFDVIFIKSLKARDMLA